MVVLVVQIVFGVADGGAVVFFPECAENKANMEEHILTI